MAYGVWNACDSVFTLSFYVDLLPPLTPILQVKQANGDHWPFKNTAASYKELIFKCVLSDGLARGKLKQQRMAHEAVAI